MREVPGALKACFVVHFAADIAFAVPLLLVPDAFLSALGWSLVDPFAARLVAAALFGIGIESLLSRNARPEAYLSLLRLKILWSSAALIGMALTVVQVPGFRTPIAFLLLAVFAGFNVLWVYWRTRLQREGVENAAH